jgi:hypothetical protein
MNNEWYSEAKSFIHKELVENRDSSGTTILSDFFEQNRNELFPDKDISDLDEFIGDEFDDFQIWLLNENIPWLIIDDTRGKWSLNTEKPQNKSIRDSDIFNIDSKFNISVADKKLLTEDEVNLNEGYIDLYEDLFKRLKLFTMQSKIAECAYRLAYCYEEASSTKTEKLIEVWTNVTNEAQKAKNKHLAFKSHKRLAEIYKLNSKHSKSAENFENAFNNRDKESKTKNTLELYTRLARYSRVQYDLDGDHKAASRMFIHEKNTEKLAGSFLEKVILFSHKYTSYYGEMPILVCVYILAVILISSYAFYSSGTSDFCPAINIVNEAVTIGPETAVTSEHVISCSSKLDNIGDSIYMSFVTFTTLGYGEITPVNIVGKVTSILLSILGVLLTSLFMVTFVRKYSRP